MTVSSWGRVPPGMPVHHHCVVSVESGHDPKMWVDASTVTPVHVAWQYQDAVTWLYEQLVEHQPQAVDEYRAHIDAAVETYVSPLVDPDADPHHGGSAKGPSSLWERVPRTLQSGEWIMEPFQIGPGRKLVLQVLGYADGDQPSDRQHPADRGYEVCGRHSRPSDKPYLGLSRRQSEHYDRYGRLYVPA